MNIALYALVVLLWGCTWIAIKLQLGTVAPAVSVAYRYLLAAACMFVWTTVRRLPMRFSFRDHARLAAVGALMYSINYVLFYLSSVHVVSGLVSIIFCLSVAFNIVGGYLFLNRPLAWSVVFAAAVGLFGLSLVFAEEILKTRAQSNITLGVFYGVAATLSFSLGNLVSTRNQERGLPVVQSTAWSMLYGALLTTAGCAALGVPFTFEITVGYWVGLLYLAVFGSCVGFVAYLTLLGRLGPERVAYATVVCPLVSLTLSTVFERYRWSVLSVAGVLLVLAANAVILGGERLRVRRAA